MQVPNAHAFSSLHFGVIKGPFMDTKNVPPRTTGRYYVTVDSAVGSSVEKICSLASSTYNFATGVGSFRMPMRGETVIIGRTIDNSFYILGSIPPRVIGEKLSAIPQIGTPSRPISENEYLIMGNRSKYPESQSYVLFDRSGGIEIKAGEYPKIHMSKGAGTINFSSLRSSTWTRSGYEKWGTLSLSGVFAKEPQKSPALWRRYVRTREADNTSPFIETIEGHVEADRDILRKQESIVSLKNINNRFFVISNKTGRTDILCGDQTFPEGGTVRPTPLQVKALKNTARIAISLDPDTNITKVRSPVIMLHAGKSDFDRTGKVTITGREFSVDMVGPISIRGNAEVRISAPSIAFSGNVSFTGPVTMNTGLIVNGAIVASGPVFGNPCTWTPN